MVLLARPVERGVVFPIALIHVSVVVDILQQRIQVALWRTHEPRMDEAIEHGATGTVRLGSIKSKSLVGRTERKAGKFRCSDLNYS